MTFILSKTLGLLLEPLVVPYFCLLCAILAFWWRRQFLGQIFVITAILLPLLYGVIPLSGQPLRFIENHIKPADMTDRQIDGIIVLGGFTGDRIVAESRGQTNLGPAAERFTAALQWHQKFPSKPLIFTGFSGRLVPDGASEVDIVQQLLDDLTIDQTHILFENKSRNTHETAEYTYNLMAPTPGSHWILITSAARMPRAISSFRAVGWSGILGYPVDYQTPKKGYSRLWDISHGAGLLGTALHEYAGLLVYLLTGHTTAFLPF